MRLTDSLSPETGLTFKSSRELPGGSVELVYGVARDQSELPGRETAWAPASQRRDD